VAADAAAVVAAAACVPAAARAAVVACEAAVGTVEVVAIVADTAVALGGLPRCRGRLRARRPSIAPLHVAQVRGRATAIFRDQVADQAQAWATVQAAVWLEIARVAHAPARAAGRAPVVGQAADRWPAVADVRRSEICKTS
jgi:hypothetical protein